MPNRLIGKRIEFDFNPGDEVVASSNDGSKDEEIYIENNSRGKIIDNIGNMYYQVKILNGKHKGRKIYVAGEHLTGYRRLEFINILPDLESKVKEYTEGTS